LKLSEGIVKAYNRKWSMINTFTVQIILNDFITRTKNGLGIEQFGDDINLSILSITTPDFTNDPIESYIANRWMIQNGKDSLYRFSITFKDYDQMSLYKKFIAIYEATKENYFDDIAITIIVSKDQDWFHEQDNPLIYFQGVLIESVSNISFSNETENQIAEFTVNFKCVYPVVTR